MVSLRKLLFGVFCAVAALLIVVVILGLLQYQFTRQYDAIIYQGEKILFRFDSLREHLTRSMLTGSEQNIEGVAEKIDALNNDLTRLLENRLVPSEYKLALINKVDMPGLTMLARKVVEEPEDRKSVLQLHDQLRTLAENLMQFDRVLTSQMKTRLVRFQGLAIGALTLIIGSVSLLIMFLYQKALLPLLSLAQALQQPNLREPLPVDPKSCKEIAELTEQINLMILEGTSASSAAEGSGGRFSFSPRELNSLSNSLNGIVNYTQLLIDESDKYYDEEDKDLLLKLQESEDKMVTILQNKLGGKKNNE